MWQVYVLYSESAGIYYKGHTKNLSRRIAEHNNGKEPFTRKFVPWRLVWSCDKPSKVEAAMLERKLKNITSHDRLLAFMKKYGGFDTDAA